jgi:hypothetical protein
LKTRKLEERENGGVTKEEGVVVFVVFTEGTWIGGASLRPRWASPWAWGFVLLFAMMTGEREKGRNEDLVATSSE